MPSSPSSSSSHYPSDVPADRPVYRHGGRFGDEFDAWRIDAGRWMVKFVDRDCHPHHGGGPRGASYIGSVLLDELHPPDAEDRNG